ncbi:hypothetical protein ACCQ13_14880 [Xanthomonas sp. NCPPB 1638]|uniref:hypothetical protein n=1 Tax=Xanthomonas TaxID=338 RepID=UPI00132ED561|nr:hypothetical protein [Xanthomonas cucurbitae]QHG87968.1 hypothetical protein EBN15_14520 [Xanthomonas cucurbitae]
MHLKPIVREALLAAFQSPDHALRRTRAGFRGATDRAFTRRAINWLEESRLADFDHRDFPSVVTLNARGIAHAQQLTAPVAQAGAA